MLVHGRKVADQIAEQVQHAAGIFLAEAAQRAVSAAWIEREDRLQVRRLLLGNMELLGSEAGDAHHPDLAVAPWLRGNPFDQIVAVPLPRTAALRFSDAARRSDDVDVSARHEEVRVAGFKRPGPQRSPCRLRRKLSGTSGP